MPHLLASVATAEEARVALRGGADIVDLKDPSAGALGALSPAGMAEVVTAIGGARPTSATIGDDLTEPDHVREAVERVRGAGVDVAKVGLFERRRPERFIEALAPVCVGAGPVVVVVFADRDPAPAWLARIAGAGCAGIVLDTAAKRGGGLRSHLSDGRIARFVDEAHAAGLFIGLAGSLRVEDLPSLLAMHPDILGFRGALCGAAGRTGALSLAAVERVRAAIPRSARESNPVWSSGAPRASRTASGPPAPARAAVRVERV